MSMCRARAEIRLGASRWGIKHLRWSVLDEPSQLRVEPLMQAAAAACSAVCGLTFEQSDPRDAHLVMSVGAGRRHDFDGKGGVLAWFQLPTNGQTQGSCFGRLDLADFDTPTPTAAPLPVIIHEAFGHGLGLPHLRRGAIMQDTYDPGIQTYTPIDVEALQYLYGPPVGSPPAKPDDIDSLLRAAREKALDVLREELAKVVDRVAERI